VVATAAGAGLVPLAPGTCGAALAIPIFVLFSFLPGALLALSWGALLALGIWASERAEGALGHKDDSRIVIDEVVGQLLALAPLLATPFSPSLGWLVTAFVLFRLFDVWKPGPVRWAERRFAGGLGVMLDDVVAGALAALVLAGLQLLVLGLPGAAGGGAA